MVPSGIRMGISSRTLSEISPQFPLDHFRGMSIGITSGIHPENQARTAPVILALFLSVLPGIQLIEIFQ